MMVKRALWITCLFAMVACVTAVCNAWASDGSEKRVALIIGNNKYAAAPLRNPVNDANAMAQKLRALGFEVLLRTDTSQREMTRALSEFGQKLVSGSVGLFYYAGHGIQARGKNYLIPIDADITTEGSVSSEAVDVERVLDQLSRSRLSMVILDACRNNPFERRFRSGPSGGLAQIDAPSGTLIAYATSPGRIALDGEGSHGTYTEALLRAIDVPGLKVEDVFKQVRIDVIKATDNQQVPWESSSLTGDFWFKGGAVAVGQARADTDVASFRQQLAHLSAELARVRSIGSSGRTPATPEEVAAWKRQIAKLEGMRGTLNLSRALISLLDIEAADADAVTKFANDAAARGYSSALALGADPFGFIVWGGSHHQPNRMHAALAATEICGGGQHRKCKPVLVNGGFDEKAFIDVAKGLQSQSLEAVRTAFLSTIKAPPLEQLHNAGLNTGSGRAGTYTFQPISPP